MHNLENNSWGIVQDIIEDEVRSAFKIRPPSVCKQYRNKKLSKNEYWKPHQFEKENNGIQS